MFGGKDGLPPNVNIKIPDEEEKNLLKANGLSIKKGTVLTTYTGGGGGFEEPLEREPESVLNDVKNRYVSIEKAKEDYKVSITSDLKIDQKLTDELRKHFRIITPDLPGQGFSTLLDQEAVSLEGFTHELISLMDLLDATPKWIIGHSAGAALAARYLLENDGQIRGILSINGAFTPFGSIAAPMFSKAAKLLSRSRWLPHLLASPSLRWRSMGSILSDTGSSVDPVMSRCYEVLLSNPEHISGTLRMMAGWNLPELTELMHTITQPIWLVACEEDRTIPPERSVSLGTQLKNARVLRLPSLGHLGHEEDPVHFASLFCDLTQA